MKRIISFYMCFTMCVALFAQATDLTIDNQTPGWLSNQINYGDQQTVKNLKVTGYINATDLKFIGSLIQNRSLNGRIDISEVDIVGNLQDNYMGENAFGLSRWYSYKLQYLYLPKSVTELSHCCSHLDIDTLVFSPNNLHYVQGDFFSWQDKLGHLILGNNVDSIPEYAFDQYYKLESIRMPVTMKYIGRRAFFNSEIKDINFSELTNLTYLGEGAFTYLNGSEIGCYYLPDTLVIPSGLNPFIFSAFSYKDGQHLFIDESIDTFQGVNTLPYKHGNRVDEKLFIHFKRMTPPVVNDYSDRLSWFRNSTLYVPKGSKGNYLNTSWKEATIIEENPVESIELELHYLDLEKDEKKLLPITIRPYDADDKTITWSVIDNTIATVDEKGYVIGISPGMTKIYATSIPTGITDSCQVVVIQHVKSIQMETPEITMTKLGETKQLNVTILPENTTDKSVTWISSNPSICTVTASGKIVAIGYGETVVIAITNDGEFPATCVVKVTPQKYHLTYIVDGMEYKSYEVESFSSITPESEPTKEGYVFSGWSEIPIIMPAKDVIITGSFTKEQDVPVTSIDDILSTSTPFPIYTPDGLPINTIQKGINIIRMSNGTIRKVYVK